MTRNSRDPLEHWPGGIDVLMLPGSAGYRSWETSPVLRALRGAGLRVRQAQRGVPVVSFKSDFELLYPPLAIFAAQVLANGGGALLADAIKSIVSRFRGEGVRTPVLLTLRVGRRLSTGVMHFFEASGPPESVLSSFTLWADGSSAAETEAVETARRAVERIHAHELSPEVKAIVRRYGKGARRRRSR